MRSHLYSLISFCLILSLIFSLTGCKKNADAESTSPANSSAPEGTESQTPEESHVLINQAANSALYPSASFEEVTILYTNDVHCGLETGLGYESVSLLKNTYASLGKNVLLVDAGDAIQGENIGSLTHGAALIEIMNQVGYDIAVPGNHEFDYGIDELLRLSDSADYPYISCNFMDKDGSLLFEPYVIKEVGGMKIAFVGISTPQSLTTSTPTYFMDDNNEFIYSFAQDEDGTYLYEMVQQAVDMALYEGADYVIALGHLGIDESSQPWTSSEVITHTHGIDAFIDGHSHTTMAEDWVKNQNGEAVLLTQTGTKLKAIGCLTIQADGTLSSALIDDSGTGDFVQDKLQELAEIEDEVVAHTDFDLCIYDPAAPDIRLIRCTETNLGDLCADSIRAITGAEIVLINGGGIRADIPAGDITYGQIIAVKPFGNYISVIEATGQQILDALEFSASALPAELGGFLQVSGLTFTIDVSVDSPVIKDKDGFFLDIQGDRRVRDVFVGSEPLDPKRVYTLGGLGYLFFEMGDGYTMFTDCSVLQDATLLEHEVLINYITDYMDGNVSDIYEDPYGDGRITILE